jgi:hypothetical protein
MGSEMIDDKKLAAMTDMEKLAEMTVEEKEALLENVLAGLEGSIRRLPEPDQTDLLALLTAVTPKLRAPSEAVREEIDALLTRFNTAARAVQEQALASAIQDTERARNDLRAQVHDIKDQIRNPSADFSAIYSTIGKFTVLFSQLEFFLRLAFEGQANVSHETTLLITSQLDFRSLVATVRGLYRQEYGDKPNWNAIERIFKTCLKVNDTRNHVAHSLWVLQSVSTFGAIHLTRQKAELQPYFNTSPEQIQTEIANLERVELDLLSLLAGDYDLPL